MSVKMRQQVEREIETAFVDAALAAGYSLSLHIDGEWVLDREKDRSKILSQLFLCDDDRIYLSNDREEIGSQGWAWFVQGNDGWDVLSDYTTNLEPIMGPVHTLADKYSD